MDSSAHLGHSDVWRRTHLGRLMGDALQQFDDRVLGLMAEDELLSLSLSNLVRRRQISAAHIHITRHLPLNGARLTDLAASASMSKQAMSKLVEQCQAWGLVERQRDEQDRRAMLILFTPTGLAWLNAFERAVAQAQQEFKSTVGDEVATVILLGLEVYTCA